MTAFVNPPAGPSGALAPPPLDRAPVVVLIGDSHLEGLAPSAQSLVAAVWPGARPEVHFKRGSTVTDWLPKVAELVQVYPAGVVAVVVVLGTNCATAAPDKVATKSAELADALQDWAGDLVWVGPPAVSRFDVSGVVAAQLRALAGRTWTYVDGVEMTRDLTFRDGVHLVMGKTGYGSWSLRIAAALQARPEGGSGSGGASGGGGSGVLPWVLGGGLLLVGGALLARRRR